MDWILRCGLGMAVWLLIECRDSLRAPGRSPRFAVPAAWDAAEAKPVAATVTLAPTMRPAADAAAWYGRRSALEGPRLTCRWRVVDDHAGVGGGAASADDETHAGIIEMGNRHLAGSRLEARWTIVHAERLSATLTHECGTTLAEHLTARDLEGVIRPDGCDRAALAAQPLWQAAHANFQSV